MDLKHALKIQALNSDHFFTFTQNYINLGSTEAIVWGPDMTFETGVIRLTRFDPVKEAFFDSGVFIHQPKDIL